MVDNLAGNTAKKEFLTSRYALSAYDESMIFCLIPFSQDEFRHREDKGVKPTHLTKSEWKRGPSLNDSTKARNRVAV
jgi:hypothetical protein